jgi:hypothetical protein
MSKIEELKPKILIRTIYGQSNVYEVYDIPDVEKFVEAIRPYVELAEWFLKHGTELSVNPVVVTDKEYAYNLGVECGKFLAKIKKQEQCINRRGNERD